MSIKNQSLSISINSLLIFLLSLSLNIEITNEVLINPSNGGQWILLHDSIGVSAMHMQLLNNNKVIIFDGTDFGPTNLTIPLCPVAESANVTDNCSAHSVLYDVASNTFRPLTLRTNTWCSSGAVNPNGTLIQTGGDHSGEKVIRSFTPCDGNSCDWVELDTPLLNRRWYASNQILPDGRIIIVGGRRAFTYEFYPKTSSRWDNRTLPFLAQTRDLHEEINLYPFLHLLPDGNLFIFANNKSILLNYVYNKVVKKYPDMPGGDRRNYPCTGSSVLLPLRLKGSYSVTELPVAEVLICGGAPAGAYVKSNYDRIYVEASRTCGRLRVSDPNPTWVMEDMPIPRVMNDMLLLPNGDVIILNGAANGSAGWDAARNAVYNPILYRPDEEPTRRFLVLNPSTIARMYHSTAALLPDGRVLVGGSNPYQRYNFTSYPYPTQLSLEAFYPPYFGTEYLPFKPSILTVENMVTYNEAFSVSFVLNSYLPEYGVSVAIVAPSFTTHSIAMNQRLVELKVLSLFQLSMYAYKVDVVGPIGWNVAPPGYYMLFVIHAGIPSHSVWVKIG